MFSHMFKYVHKQIKKKKILVFQRCPLSHFEVTSMQYKHLQNKYSPDSPCLRKHENPGRVTVWTAAPGAGWHHNCMLQRSSKSNELDITVLGWLPF